MNETKLFYSSFFVGKMTNDSQKSKWRGRAARYAPLVFWTGAVLFASNNIGSMTNTSRIIRPLLHFLFPNVPEETLTVYHIYIRKLAHLTEYGILAFWAARAFSASSAEFLRKYRFIAAFLLVAVVASIDETNQSFLPSRTGSIYDVMLDATGGLIMILIFASYRFFKNRRNN